MTIKIMPTEPTKTTVRTWGLVITMVLISVFFIVRFVPMRTRLGKRSGGALITFIVALFAEPASRTNPAVSTPSP